jgi:8-oxo-dGTP pyrophosphatase MutT (NUDIX family)
VTTESAVAPELPEWLHRLQAAAATVRPEQLSRFLPPEEGGRDSAVLLLFAGDESVDPSTLDGADVLLIERSHGMRSHAGQVAFPGGGMDPEDAGPVEAALREAVEETGLDPAGVQVFGALPAIFLPVSDYVVTPVLAWWQQPSPVDVVDTAEVASVHRVPLPELLDPTNRFQSHHPSGYTGASFEVAGLLVWGFTAGLLDRLLRLAGWERPWDTSRVEDLPAEVLERIDREMGRR